MFTLLVSWLLVACIPALLMLTTLGLERLERTLADDTLTASDVALFLEHAQPVDVHTLALTEAPPPKALTGKHHADPFQAHTHFPVGATRHVNRV
ncbi:hypothetical protein F0Q45_06035 [Mycobacterium simiae]|uniref:Uncharacterized protein n=1 Tax=Mycobacterium simiae TaxID=1784 RepID=A0A5B1BT16_MYCSI|nr:hypothetical protein F0Q45_06035 [Mycobacterium simiae]